MKQGARPKFKSTLSPAFSPTYSLSGCGRRDGFLALWENNSTLKPPQAELSNQTPCQQCGPAEMKLLLRTEDKRVFTVTF